MDQLADKHLDNLTLSNINQKMKMLRDQIRASVNQDISNMKVQINDYNEKRKQSSFLPNNSSFQNHFDVQQYYRPSSNLIQTPVNGNHSSNNKRQEQHVVTQSKQYRHITLVQRQIDFDDLKYLNAKKISAEQTRTYIRFVLNQEIWHKISQLWLQYEDEYQKVEMKTFVNRLFRLGLHYIQATAVEIPKIKKKINLKKVLFEIAYKYESSSQQKITWRTFKNIVQHYKYEISPTIDSLVKKFQEQKERILRTNFIIPREVLEEIKNIYRRCSADHFLSYCRVKTLIEKLQKSKIIQKHINNEVRRKSHVQAASKIKDTIQYMKKKSPVFIDLDQFILYFSTRPFTFYPIQENECISEQQSVYKTSKESKQKRIRSIKSANNKQKSKTTNGFLHTFNLFSPNKKENEQLSLNQKQQKQSQQVPFKFKARPIPKSLSNQKYKQFLNTLEHRKEKMRNKEVKEKQMSQKLLERMKSETKLLSFPKLPQPQQSLKPELEGIKTVFKARPVPESVLQAKLKNIEEQKTSRKNKILSLTLQKYKHSWQELPCVATQRNYSPIKQEQKDKIITQYYYAREIPDYKTEQQKLFQQLEQKKKRFKPTQVQQFYFHTKERHPQLVCKQKTQPNYQQMYEQQEQQYDYKRFLYSPEPEIYYTQKLNDMIVANKNRIYQRQLSLNKKLQEQEERQKRHKNFAKFMKGPMSKIPNTAKICEIQSKTKIQRHKKYWKKLDIQYESDLNELYSKVIKRPFLYEMQSAYQKANKVEVNEPLQEKIHKKTKKKNKNAQKTYKEVKLMNKSL